MGRPSGNRLGQQGCIVVLAIVRIELKEGQPCLVGQERVTAGGKLTGDVQQRTGGIFHPRQDAEDGRLLVVVEIGRASCRERGGVGVGEVAVRTEEERRGGG